MTVAAAGPDGSWRTWTGEAPTRLLTPGPDEVHLWRASLARPGEHVARLARTLSPDERDRAARFRAARDRRRFVVARGLLRALLGRYLGEPAETVGFAYGPAGKPALASPGPGSPLRFNVAHSGDLAAYAVAWNRRVGVDVEAVRPLEDLSQASRLVFSEPERVELWSFPPEHRERAFFDGWTRKEAMLKAIGDGLNGRLRGTRVSLGREDAQPLRAIDGEPAAVARWTLLDVAMGTGYAAAVAVEGGRPRVVQRDVPGVDHT